MIASIHNDLVTRRALGVHAHACCSRADVLLAMSGADTDMKGRRYVVLRDGSIDVRAACRVRNDGRLKRLKRWPAELG